MSSSASARESEFSRGQDLARDHDHDHDDEHCAAEDAEALTTSRSDSQCGRGGNRDRGYNPTNSLSAEDSETTNTSATAGGGGGAGGGTQTVSYSAEKVIGNGSFGVVFKAVVVQTGEVVAIKKVLQDKRFKNRELQIMRKLEHPNIVRLKHCFYANGENDDELYLNLVLEYVPETVYRICRNYKKKKQPVPALLVRLYIYQLGRALAHIHALGICHRDIKPQNLLVDPKTQTLKLCDFGSAKKMVATEPNVSYICSRYYRAPELIFGSTEYNTDIDIWSLGCVFGELLLGQPLFPGQNGVDQLVEIIRSLGTPSREAIESMNRSYTEFEFPQIQAHPWENMFHADTDPDAIDLISKMIVYKPSERIHPLEACAHVYFDDLRKDTTCLLDGSPLPETLFQLTPIELQYAPRDEIIQILTNGHKFP